MIALPIEQLQAAPSLGALVGTVSSAPVIHSFNQRWGNSQGVIFGQTGDPYKDNYAHFNTLVNDVMIPVQHQVTEIIQNIEKPKLQPIQSESDLRDISDNMKVPILVYEPVRKLFEEDKIYGFGYDKKYLPHEDVYGRLIDNFSADFNHKELPSSFIGIWESSDPKLSDEDLDAIIESRKFIDEWLEQQLGSDGDRIDPTDLDNVIKK